jgi:hypothetical protein
MPFGKSMPKGGNILDIIIIHDMGVEHCFRSNWIHGVCELRTHGFL